MPVRGRRLGRFVGQVRGYLVVRLRRAEVDQGFDTLLAGLSWVAGFARLAGAASASCTGARFNARAPENPRLRPRLAMPEPGTRLGEATM
jgi:hypothetical protein